MKNNELYRLQNCINEVADIQSTKFAYCIAKNARLIKQEIEDLRSALTKHQEQDEHKKYIESVQEVLKEYCDKDETGKPAIQNDQFQFANISPGDKQAMEEKIKLVEVDNQELVEQGKKLQKEFVSVLNEKCSLEFHKMKIDSLPDSLTPKQLDGIFELIEE